MVNVFLGFCGALLNHQNYYRLRHRAWLDIHHFFVESLAVLTFSASANKVKVFQFNFIIVGFIKFNNIINMFTFIRRQTKQIQEEFPFLFKGQGIGIRIRLGCVSG